MRGGVKFTINFVYDTKIQEASATLMIDRAMFMSKAKWEFMDQPGVANQAKEWLVNDLMAKIKEQAMVQPSKFTLI